MSVGFSLEKVFISLHQAPAKPFTWHIAAKFLQLSKKHVKSNLIIPDFIHSMGHRGVQKAIESIIILMED